MVKATVLGIFRDQMIHIKAFSVDGFVDDYEQAGEGFHSEPRHLTVTPEGLFDDNGKMIYALRDGKWTEPYGLGLELKVIHLSLDPVPD